MTDDAHVFLLLQVCTFVVAITSLLQSSHEKTPCSASAVFFNMSHDSEIADITTYRPAPRLYL